MRAYYAILGVGSIGFSSLQAIATFSMLNQYISPTLIPMNVSQIDEQRRTYPSLVSACSYPELCVVKKKKKNEKYVGLGTSFENCFVPYTTQFCDIKKNTKLLVVAFLYDGDSKDFWLARSLHYQVGYF
eukprot:Em0073g3a